MFSNEFSKKLYLKSISYIFFINHFEFEEHTQAKFSTNPI